jgi:hypothetical protein
MRNRIIQWRRGAPSPTGFCSVLWLDLNMHISLTLLHRPSPRNPKPSKEDLIMARQGASGAMRTYKEMLKTGRINWGPWTVLSDNIVADLQAGCPCTSCLSPESLTSIVYGKRLSKAGLSSLLTSTPYWTFRSAPLSWPRYQVSSSHYSSDSVPHLLSDDTRLHESVFGFRDPIRTHHTTTHSKGELGSDIPCSIAISSGPIYIRPSRLIRRFRPRGLGFD